MTEYRTLDDVTIDYFTEHPNEMDAFLSEAFADYAQDSASGALLSTLQVIAPVKCSE